MGGGPDQLEARCDQAGVNIGSVPPSTGLKQTFTRWPMRKLPIGPKPQKAS